MEKNWLIRTKNLKILGPVSAAKIIELVEKGSLSGEDELCTGNGFWFWVREKEFLQKYLLSNEVQPHNPLSDASEVMGTAKAPSIKDCINFPVKGNIVAEAAKKILTEHSHHGAGEDATKVTNLADFFKTKNGLKNTIVLSEVHSGRNIENKDDQELPEEEEEVLYPSSVDLEFPMLSQKTDKVAQENIIVASEDGSGMILQLSQENILDSEKSEKEASSEAEVDIGILLSQTRTEQNPKEEGKGAQKIADNQAVKAPDVKGKSLQNATDEEVEEDILLPSVDDLEYPTLENIEAVKRGEKIPEVVKSKMQEVLVDLKRPTNSEIIIPIKESSKNSPKNIKKSPPETPVDVAPKEAAVDPIPPASKTIKKKVSKKTKTKIKKNTNRRKGLDKDTVFKLAVLVGSAILVLLFLLRFTDVLANEKRSLDVEKKKIWDFPPLVSGEIVIPIKIGPEGFVFERSDMDIQIDQIDCNQINNFYYQLKLILFSNTAQLLKRKTSLLAICPNARNDVVARFNLMKQDILEEKQVEKYLISNGIEKNSVRRIMFIHGVKRKLLLQKDYMDNFINKVDQYFKTPLKSNFFDRDLEQLSLKYPDTMLAFYFRILSYWQAGNLQKVKELIRKLVSASPLELIFKNEVVGVISPAKHKEYVSSIVKWMKLIEKDLQGKLEYQMLINYFSLIHDTLEIYELKKRNDADWSVDKIMELSQSVNFGLPNFSLWVSLLRVFDTKLASDFVYQKVNESVMKNLNMSALWVFGMFEIDETKISHILASRVIQELSHSQKAWDEYLTMGFLQNSSMSNQIKKANAVYDQSLAKIEYDFYKKMLNTGLAIEFAIYQLLRRNIVDDDYLWWLSL